MRVRKLTSWWGALALLVAVRLAIPLAAYAAGNSRLPGIPRFTRPQRHGPALGRPARSRVLDGVAAARRADRRPRRMGQQPVGHRRRPAQLRRAAVDVARDGRRRARALAAPDVVTTGAR